MTFNECKIPVSYQSSTQRKGQQLKINRRRAPSSETSREKKLGGHENESIYAQLIEAEVVKGTNKTDVIDLQGRRHSVKSGLKWQIFLYSHDRIASSKYLKILLPCVDAFPENWDKYDRDRTICIAYKEEYVRKHGREKAKKLQNSEVATKLGKNLYMQAKEDLALATHSVAKRLRDKDFLQKFLAEAIFNNEEVSFLAIKDVSFKRDDRFKVFTKEDVLRVLSDNLLPTTSKAGLVPEDYNVAGQKTLLRYERTSGENVRLQNIVEIEIRNESKTKYRLVRFNMKSRDTLHLLSNAFKGGIPSDLNDQVLLHGNAARELNK